MFLVELQQAATRIVGLDEEKLKHVLNACALILSSLMQDSISQISLLRVVSQIYT